MSSWSIEPYTGKTPLMVLLERGDEDGALRLLVPNSNTQLAAAHEVDAVDRWESTALHYAAMWGCDRAAQRLLALRAMPQRRNGAGLSALDLAAKWDHDTTFEVLLRGEGLADFGGWTPYVAPASLRACAALLASPGSPSHVSTHVALTHGHVARPCLRTQPRALRHSHHD